MSKMSTADRQALFLPRSFSNSVSARPGTEERPTALDRVACPTISGKCHDSLDVAPYF
ncbi:hypothetical protein REMIM1_PE00479 (plasmid) [Rhizobium etli bv. mimosae str. Mim1]|nr:hypothetical protein REMIM1_PE00479 [Rhizobium etli bv. mimosae str. Mim1]